MRCLLFLLCVYCFYYVLFTVSTVCCLLFLLCVVYCFYCVLFTVSTVCCLLFLLCVVYCFYCVYCVFCMIHTYVHTMYLHVIVLQVLHFADFYLLMKAYLPNACESNICTYCTYVHMYVDRYNTSIHTYICVSTLQYVRTHCTTVTAHLTVFAILNLVNTLHFSKSQSFVHVQSTGQKWQQLHLTQGIL